MRLNNAYLENFVARIAGVNIPTNKRVEIALQYIHGIGPAAAKDITEKVGIEAAIRMGWDAIIGSDGIFVGMSGFGASAPAKELYKHFGITPERVAELALAKLGKN